MYCSVTLFFFFNNWIVKKVVYLHTMSEYKNHTEQYVKAM